MPAWHADEDESLRTLWDSGMTTVLIGQAMGISKNAVIGRAHRLGLSLRASPIVRHSVMPAAAVDLLPKPEPKQPAGQKLVGRRIGRRVVMQRVMVLAGGKTLWRLRCDCGREDVVAEYHLRGVTAARECSDCSRTREDQRAAAVQATNVPAVELGSVTHLKPAATVKMTKPGMRSCQYPTTDNRPWRFCCEPVQSGLPYCHIHAERCYAHARRHAEAAA